MSNLPPMQLRMSVDAACVVEMPEVKMPTGYVMRAYLPGDVKSWADTLQKGDFGDGWNDMRVLEYLEDTDRREGSRVVEFDGRIVAATFASTRRYPADETSNSDNEVAEGILDFVVTHPDHRGKGIGRATCTEVARFLVGRGYKTVVLHTDDWRLPAIHVYLSLGFKPVMNRSDMPKRWAVVYENLKEGGRNHAQARTCRIGARRNSVAGERSRK